MIPSAILLFVLLALWHFVYESILAPSWRMRLRNQLFACRDELRCIRIEDDELPQEVFLCLQQMLNNAILYLHAIRPSTLHELKSEIESNAGLRRLVANRRKIIADCGIQEIQQIDRKVTMIISEAFVANAGGWLVYMVPIALCVAFKEWVTQSIEKILAVPEKQSRQLAY